MLKAAKNTPAPGESAISGNGLTEQSHGQREQKLLAQIRRRQSEEASPSNIVERPPPRIPDHELIRRIGEGAYGEVWLARNAIGSARAVKVVYRDSFGDERPYEREFRGIQKFEPISRSNDSLVDILQVGRNDSEGWFYYVMELADDVLAPVNANAKGLFPVAETYTPHTLRHEITKHGRLSFDDCLQLALSLNLALGQLHRHNLIHRDIKPSNIIFIGGVPKLADIGLVTNVIEARSFVGTEGFIPPEGPNSPQGDIYSLGKVLYEASMGKDRLDFPEPFTSLGQTDGSEKLEELNAVILKACATDVRERYQTVEEMHLDLALLQSGKSVKWKRVIEQRLARLGRLALAVGVVAGLAIAGFVFQRHQTREARRLQIQAEQLTAQMQMLNAQNLFARGESALALAHIAQVLRTHPDNRVAAEQLVNALNQRHFAKPAARPMRHEASVQTARFSPDGQTIATTSHDFSVRVWNTASSEERFPSSRHTAPINSLAFSPDGSRILSASEDGTARVIDARTGVLVFPPLQHPAPVRAAAYDPTGGFIVTGSFDTRARVFRAASGELLYPSLAHEDKISSVAFAPDGTLFATTTERGATRVWQTVTGTLQHHLPHEGSSGAFVDFSPDGKWLVTVAKDEVKGGWRVYAWNVTTGAPLFESLRHPDRIYTIGFSPDGQGLVTACYDNSARVWELPAGRLSLQLRHASIVSSAVFSADGREILTGSVDQSARLWNARNGAQLSEPMLHDGRVVHAEFSPDSKQVLTASWDKTVKLWDIESRPTAEKRFVHDLAVIFAEEDRLSHQVVTGTGGRIFTANNINTWLDRDLQHQAVLWDTAAELRKVTPSLPFGAVPLVAQFTRSGPLAVIAERLFASRAQVWDLQSQQPLGANVEQTQSIICARFSPDGLIFATGSEDDTARVWDTRTGSPLTPVLVHGRRVQSLSFNGDGTRLITASRDGSARIWDTRSGESIAPALKHDAEVWFAQFSPDGQRVVTTSLDHTARIWSTNGSLIAVLQHSAAVEYAEFSTDGSIVVTAAGDHSARLWDAATGHQLTEPLEHRSSVLTARFSPDGKRVVTASIDRTAQVWDVATGLRLGDALRHGDWAVSAAFNSDGSAVLTASADGTARIWPFETVSGPVPAWLPDLVEVAGGKKLSKDRIPQNVTWEEFRGLKARLLAQPASDRYSRLAHRFFGSSPGLTPTRYPAPPLPPQKQQAERNQKQ